MVVRICGENGCLYKTGNTMSMKRHKQSKLGVVAKWKNTFFEDGNARGNMNPMRDYQVSKHS